MKIVVQHGTRTSLELSAERVEVWADLGGPRGGALVAQPRELLERIRAAVDFATENLLPGASVDAVEVGEFPGKKEWWGPRARALDGWLEDLAIMASAAGTPGSEKKKQLLGFAEPKEIYEVRPTPPKDKA